jgi:cellulose synthase/poly-beta-1,6-N-acetylglucosamine synthase-like glycosyltransferase
MLLALRSEAANRYEELSKAGKAGALHGHLEVVEGGTAPSTARTASPSGFATTSSLAVAPAPEPLRPSPVDWGPGSLQHLRAARLLVRKGLLSSSGLASAIADQLASQSTLGEVLIGKGLVRPIAYYQALAEVLSLAFVNLHADPPDDALVEDRDRAFYAAMQMLPWRRHARRVVLAAVTIGRRQLDWAEANYGEGGFEFVITSPFDIFWDLQRRYRDADSLQAREALYLWKPEHSAKLTVTSSQRTSFIAAAAAYLIFLAIAPRAALVATMAAITALYTVTFLLKFLLTWVGASRKVDMDISAEDVAALTDAELPVYTVLVPMYREARVMPLVVQSLKRLDYPASKLEVKLVLEEDDAETIAAAKQLNPPGSFEIVRVPASYPKTKPKACNYALLFARGDFITIYDAEDQPEPDQLKKAVIAFRRSGDKLACVQARLNYYNRSENWLTRMFTLEYSQWFDFLLPGLDKLKMPIPLGGTSNHFRLAVLRQVRGWDPYNVTEDADLGIRLAQEGYSIGVINSTTFEEANGVLRSWIRQRSRWLKGYMQTWLVHMRHPGELWRTVGARGTFAFHFFIGAPPLLKLMNPIMWTITILFYVFHVTGYDWLFPEPIGTLATFNLFFANSLLIYFGVVAALKRRYLDLVPTGILQPVYWALQSIAAYKALWQLLSNPHFWEKTEHGTSAVTQAHLAKASEATP